MSSLLVPLLVVAAIVAACDGCKSDGPKRTDAGTVARKADDKKPDAAAVEAPVDAGPELKGPTRPVRPAGALDAILDEAARLAKAGTPLDAEVAALADKVKAIVEKASAKAKLTDVAVPPPAGKRVDVAVNTLGPDAGTEIDGGWGVTRDGVVKKVVNGILIADGSVHVGEASNALVVASDVAFVDKCASCIVIAGGRIDVLHVVTAPAAPAGKKGDKPAAKRSVLLSGGELTSADANGALLGSGDGTTLVKENDVTKLAAEPDLVLASRRTLAPIEAGASTSTPAEGEAVVRAKEGRSGRKTLLGKPPMTRKGPIPGTEGWILAQVTEKFVAFRNEDVFAVVPVIPIDRSLPPGKGGDEEE